MVAELLALTLIAEVPEVVREVGLKEMVSPDVDGDIVYPIVTAELKPPVKVTVTVSVTVEPPRVAVRLVGEAESVKFCTARLTVMLWVMLPLVPVMVRV